MEAYVHGVSTRKVADLVAALGIEAGVSKSEVSRIRGELDATVGAFRERPLDHSAFPYLCLDATHVKAKEGASVVSKAIVVATGVTATGERGVLGLDVGDSEDGAFWTGFLRSLRARGLGGGGGDAGRRRERTCSHSRPSRSPTGARSGAPTPSSG